jgi:O-antigen/teichoic acid export membrane protein
MFKKKDMNFKILNKVKITTLNFIKINSIHNVFWNFGAGVWLALLIILSTPWYISKLGLELYGVLSIWLVFQALMSFFDFGLGATMIREFAAAKLDKAGVIHKQDLLKTIEIFYWIIACVLFFFLVIFSVFFSNDWFTFNISQNINIVYIMLLISCTLFFQFPNVLYFNGLIGLQNHKLMNILQISGNSLRYGIGSLVLFFRNDLIWFFYAQILVAILQTFVTRYFLWNGLNRTNMCRPVFRLDLLRYSARFSGGMALTSIAAVMISNIDRIAISRILPASDLGKYAIAFTATGLLQLGIQPFYRAFFPRYAELYSFGDYEKLKNEYFFSNKMIAIIIISLGIICLFFAEDIFFSWMKITDLNIIKSFRLLILGILCSGLGWLPAAMQQAQGWTSLHVKMIFGSIVIGLPLMIFAIHFFGIIGGTVVWLVHGISDITLGLWLMHRRIFKGELSRWYLTVILPPIIISFPITYLSFLLKPLDLARFESLIWIFVTGAILILINLYYTLKKQ